MRGREWTAADDAAIREFAARVWCPGRLKDCAGALGRTYDAVRKRASRRGAVMRSFAERWWRCVWWRPTRCARLRIWCRCSIPG